MSANSSTRAGDITKFLIRNSADETKNIDLSAIVQEVSYYEDVFQPSVQVKATILESGMTDKPDIGPFGILNTLPVRGGEPVILKIEDNQDTPNELAFEEDKQIYVNKVSNIDPGTQKDLYNLDFCTKEYLTNNQTRVRKRYDGRVNSNVFRILRDILGVEEERIDTDTTAIPYNFIGNDKKPFYVCSWLAGKAVPATATENRESTIGGAAGYFFYETYDGFKFKAIDTLLSQQYVDPDGKSRNYTKKYILTGKPELPESGEYHGKLLSVNIGRFIDLERNLNLGTYANRTIFYNPYGSNYTVRDYSIGEDQKDKVNNAGSQDLDWTAEEFSQTPSRLMSRVLDIGSLPSGINTRQQLESWKNDPDKPTYDSANAMVQSVMRYNQLFTIKTDVIIPGDFSLRAGDLIYCDFPTLTAGGTEEVNQETGGIYMIASLCHRLTREDCFTSLTLVRDTFGRKPWTD